MWIVLIPVLAVVGLLLIVFVIMYNGLIGKKNLVEQAFGTIDVQLKKRADLIPNLVATVQRYMKHESETLTKITELRAQATSPRASSDERLSIESRISSLLQGLMIQVENYPELKANENFMHLQATLNEVEAQLAAARRTYNAAVTDFNNAVEMFPTNMVAGMMGFRRRQLFEIEEADRQRPDVGKMFDG
ncbi:MAG: LemA family protein [Planctomycetota bacterium]